MIPHSQKHTQIHHQQEDTLHIYVHEGGSRRWLEFGDDVVQSIINLQRPQDLIAPVHQAMLTGLLFLPAPRRMLLLGLGGGAIARYMAHRQPDCHGDAVELSPAVADIAQQFFDFPTAWGLHVADARDYIAQATLPDGQHIDCMMLDIAEQQHSPDWVSDSAFLGHCRQQLSAHGVLVINLMPRDAAEFTHQLAAIRGAFEARTLCLSVPQHRNILIFAFAQRPVFSDMAQLQQRVAGRTEQWGLPFDEFLGRMVRENPAGSGVF